MKLTAGFILALAAIALAAFALQPARRVAAPATAPLRVARAPQALATVPVAAVSVAAPALPEAAAARRAEPSPVATEADFMRDLRVLGEMEPELAIERAAEGKARFGDSADAPERRSILIHALARVGRASEARGEAERMVNECPDSAWVSEIERFTGAHRHRNIRLAANGRLEYE